MQERKKQRINRLTKNTSLFCGAINLNFTCIFLATLLTQSLKRQNSYESSYLCAAHIMHKNSYQTWLQSFDSFVVSIACACERGFVLKILLYKELAEFNKRFNIPMCSSQLKKATTNISPKKP